MRTLNAEAKDVLRSSGITQATWRREFFGPDATVWGGDACGCPDDRCIGFHHDADESCGCLDALTQTWLQEHDKVTSWVCLRQECRDTRVPVTTWTSAQEAMHEHARQGQHPVDRAVEFGVFYRPGHGLGSRWYSLAHMGLDGSAQRPPS